MTKLLASLLLVFSLNANAEFVSGKQLHDWLQSNDKTANALATGYILGTFDTGAGIIHCTTESINAGALVSQIKMLIERATNRETFSADVAINAWLSNTYPCKQGTNI